MKIEKQDELIAPMPTVVVVMIVMNQGNAPPSEEKIDRHSLPGVPVDELPDKPGSCWLT